MDTTESTSITDTKLAHALARVGLGINITMHGVSRLPHISAFASTMRDTLSQGLIPAPLVYATSTLIPPAETVIGVMLIVGLATRRALVGGTLLMFVLIAGACSAQLWEAASTQMIYLGFYVMLLACLRHDALSLDAWRANRRARARASVTTVGP